MTKTFKAAVVQAASLPEDSMASAAKAASLIDEAAGAGAKLIVFPEAFIGGYPKGNSFGTPVGMRKPGGRSEEHTSELQSLMRISYAVFCLKKNNKTNKLPPKATN